MKRSVALVALALLGFIVAGCASGHEAASNVTTLTSPHSVLDVSTLPDTLVVSGTATIPNVASGTEIACEGGQPKVRVPAKLVAADAYEVGEVAGGRWSDGGPTTNLRLSRSRNSTVTVTCSRK